MMRALLISGDDGFYLSGHHQYGKDRIQLQERYGRFQKSGPLPHEFGQNIS